MPYQHPSGDVTQHVIPGTRGQPQLERGRGHDQVGGTHDSFVVGLRCTPLGVSEWLSVPFTTGHHNMHKPGGGPYCRGYLAPRWKTGAFGLYGGSGAVIPCDATHTPHGHRRMTTGTDHKIADLQILRGVSILMVFFTHLPLFSPVMAVFPHPVTNPLWLGVEVFFVLSGYVITNALARDRYEPLSFAVRRVFRLTPAVVCFLLVAAGVFALYLYGGVPDAEVPRVHGVTKAKATSK